MRRVSVTETVSTCLPFSPSLCHCTQHCSFCLPYSPSLCHCTQQCTSCLPYSPSLSLFSRHSKVALFGRLTALHILWNIFNGTVSQKIRNKTFIWNIFSMSCQNDFPFLPLPVQVQRRPVIFGCLVPVRKKSCLFCGGPCYYVRVSCMPTFGPNAKCDCTFLKTIIFFFEWYCQQISFMCNLIYT